MKLVLINDLPLFSGPPDATGLSQVIRAHAEPLCQQLPATTTYVGFEELISTWSRATSETTAEVMVLVGTRPPLLAGHLPTGSILYLRQTWLDK